MNPEKVDASRTTTVPAMRLATSKLIDALKGGSPSDTLTDEQLKELCGKDCSVDGDGYAYLGSAIRHVLRNHGVVWKRIVGAGLIKCLDTGEIVEVAKGARRHTYKHEKRTLCKLAVAADGATEQQRPEVMLQLAQHGTLAHMSSSGMTKKLEAREVVETPDPARLLAAMVKNGSETG